jgi:hypothetical protein
MTLREAAEPSLHEQVAVLLADRDRLQRELAIAQGQLEAHQRTPAWSAARISELEGDVDRLQQDRDEAYARVRAEASKSLIAEHDRDAALALVAKLRTALRPFADAYRRPGIKSTLVPIDVAYLHRAYKCLAAEEPRTSPNWRYCTSRGHEIGERCEDAADCSRNGCALGRAAAEEPRG